ncbi:dyslexia-associated protein KIAA0319 homolog [Bufo gargarizans]|uniref:dyslexia-associated protein KIAA0319 homolog n=1 Tax=Bufo gargarizans TaxID=30331 RepID=UPI001CF53506|nr:dyslexia-associated protein KIAA0319 homolog [Bufo gargarizans]
MAPNIMTLCIYTLFIWLCTIAGHLCDQCREGAMLTNAAISPNLQKTHLKRVPNARTMSECTMACCNHSGCDLSWMLGRQCYIVNCQHKESCEPQKVDRMQSYLTFILRPSPKFIPYALYENIPSNREYSLTDQGDQEEDMTSFKDLSSLIKNPSLEDLTDYTDDYNIPQLDLLHLNANEGDKVRSDLDYIGWILPELNKNTTTVEIGRRDDDLIEHPREESLTKGNVNHVSETPSMSTTTEMALTRPMKSTEMFVEELPTLLPNSTLEKLASSDVFGKSEKQPTVQSILEPQENTELTNSTVPTSRSIINNVVSTSSANNPVNEFTVTTAGNIEVTLPTHEVQLNVFVSPEAPADIPYAFEWKLISQPTDFQGELKMANTRSPTLSKLTAGLYRLSVSVSRENVVVEGFVNITVKPAARINLPPTAVVSPKSQEVSLPSTSAFIDASQSTDDDKIIAYHWEQTEGSLQEMNTEEDNPVLHLTNLVPGNYTFRLTVADYDGAKNSTEAYVVVNKVVDNPPVADAGPNQLLTLPQNDFSLNGNLSTDDQQIISYEWSLSPSSTGKLMAMKGVHSPYLQATATHAGEYTFQLTVTDSSNQQSTAQATVIVQPENNSPPVAETGPDKEIIFPVESTTLDGSKSSDDHGIVSYKWEKISGPSAVTIQDSDKPVAVVSNLQLGTYHFHLTVIDHEGLESSAVLSVTVKEGKNSPPKANAGGTHVLVLPNSSISLDGSKSIDDQSIVSYAWTRDSQSPAAGDVMDSSWNKPVLHLTNLVEGIYRFHLKVTDTNGDSDIDMATVEVRPDPRKANLVELILEVAVSQLSEQQKDTLVRQLAVLLNVLDSDVKIQKIQAHSDISTVIIFYVQSGHPVKIRKSVDVAHTLQKQLLKEKADFLLYKVLRVDTAVCLLKCSGHGHCDPITKSCICYPFWIENWLRRYVNDGESNCEWSVLYIIVLAFALVAFLMGLTWVCMCCYKSRKRTKIRKKTKYTILDNFDDQERMALRPKYGIKHRSTEHNSSLMVSESEFDSDQDTIFTRDKVDQDNPKNISSSALKNGAPFNFSSKCR